MFALDIYWPSAWTAPRCPLARRSLRNIDTTRMPHSLFYVIGPHEAGSYGLFPDAFLPRFQHEFKFIMATFSCRRYSRGKGKNKCLLDTRCKSKNGLLCGACSSKFMGWLLPAVIIIANKKPHANTTHDSQWLLWLERPMGSSTPL